ISIHLPTLNEREEDVIVLAEHFLKYSKLQHEQPITIQQDAQDLLLKHTWSGNVSELKNCIQQAALSQQGGSIQAADLPQNLQDSSLQFALNHQIQLDHYNSFNLKEALALIEKNALIAALDKYNWNQYHTAKFLCMNRTTLIEKIRKRGLKKPD
ncbi:MAG: helix-turn-helix domain-containing protein, partial [Mariprofundaceae bacterium]|nr:helix-turn-helix domain-containing protein [Mariprofundaceae bacterium]